MRMDGDIGGTTEHDMRIGKDADRYRPVDDSIAPQDAPGRLQEAWQSKEGRWSEGTTCESRTARMDSAMKGTRRCDATRATGGTHRDKAAPVNR